MLKTSPSSIWQFYCEQRAEIDSAAPEGEGGVPIASKAGQFGSDGPFWPKNLTSGPGETNFDRELP
jgi:hypothetical protein